MGTSRAGLKGPTLQTLQNVPCTGWAGMGVPLGPCSLQRWRFQVSELPSWGHRVLRVDRPSQAPLYSALDHLLQEDPQTQAFLALPAPASPLPTADGWASHIMSLELSHHCPRVGILPHCRGILRPQARHEAGCRGQYLTEGRLLSVPVSTCHGAEDLRCPEASQHLHREQWPRGSGLASGTEA